MFVDEFSRQQITGRDQTSMLWGGFGRKLVFGHLKLTLQHFKLVFTANPQGLRNFPSLKPHTARMSDEGLSEVIFASTYGATNKTVYTFIQDARSKDPVGVAFWKEHYRSMGRLTARALGIKTHKEAVEKTVKDGMGKVVMCYEGNVEIWELLAYRALGRLGVAGHGRKARREEAEKVMTEGSDEIVPEYAGHEMYWNYVGMKSVGRLGGVASVKAHGQKAHREARGSREEDTEEGNVKGADKRVRGTSTTVRGE